MHKAISGLLDEQIYRVSKKAQDITNIARKYGVFLIINSSHNTREYITLSVVGDEYG